jgi:hypothetical protein
MFMHDKQNKPLKRPVGADRPFPWRCRQCGQVEVYPSVIRFDVEQRHDGHLYAFTVPDLKAPVCRNCNNMVVTLEVDDQINAALRAHLHLLTPAEMRGALARIGLTQKEAAERMGIAGETLSYWLTETQIQSRAMDNLLRAFFAFPAVRDALQSHDPQLGLADLTPQSVS